LSESEVFEELGDDELTMVAQIARQETFEPGARIIAENDEAKDLYIVLQGRVAILIELGDGKQIVVDTVTKNGSFGWSAMVPPYTYTASAKCSEQTKVVAVPGSGLRDLCRGNCRTCYSIMERLATVISARLKDTRLQLISLLYG
jgi:CRP-like cAMP-binding protein